MASKRLARLVGAPLVGVVLVGASVAGPVPDGPAVAATEPPPVEVAAGVGPALGEGPGLGAVRRDEVVAKRTEHSRTFETSWPGVHQTEIFTRPVFAHDQTGALVPVETSLVPSSDGGFRSAVSDGPVSVPASLSGGAKFGVQSPDGQWVRWAPVSSGASTARVAGSEATYAGVWPGVDLSVRDTGSGAKETYTLASPTAPAELRVSVETSGLEGTLDGDGNIKLRDRTGRDVFVIPHGWMADSRSTLPNPEGFSDGVTYSWTPGASAGTATLGIHLDGAWLASPDRRYPVRVDPGVFDTTASGDSFVWGFMGGGGTHGSDPQLFTGTLPWFGGYTRTLMKFDLTPIAEDMVIDAQLALNNFDYVTCESQIVKAHQITGPWDPATVTWANKPPIATGALSSAKVPVGDPRDRHLPDPGCKATIAWSAGSLVRDWVQGATTNYGIELVASPESGQLNLYRSTESAVPADQYPRLVVAHSERSSPHDPIHADAPIITQPPTTLSSPNTPTVLEATYTVDGTGMAARVVFYLYDATTGRMLMAKRSDPVGPGQPATYTLDANDKAFLQCRMDLTHEFRLEATAVHEPPSPNENEGVFGPTSTRVFNYAITGGRTPLVCLDFPDPAIVGDGQTFYIFATNLAQGDTNYGWDQHYNVPVLSSADGVTINGSFLPTEALPNTNVGAWVKKTAGTPDQIWAPDVEQFNGTWVLYYSAKHTNGLHCIGVATSTTIEGPYQDVASASPLVCTGDTGCSNGCIDASVAYEYPEGTPFPYLLWRSDPGDTTCGEHACLFSRQLNSNGLGFAEPAPHLLLDSSMSGPWTFDDPQFANTVEQPEWAGPAETTNVLFYSGSTWTNGSYGIGYAHCTSITELCTDQSNGGPWFWNADAVPDPPPGSNTYAKGPGSLSVTQANCDGELLFAHHGWTNNGFGYPLGSRATFLSGLAWYGDTPQATPVASIFWNCA